MINFTLDNLEDYEREFGDKFYLLPRKKRQNLKRGDLVKLIFRFEDDESDFAQVERMWVIIKYNIGGNYVGILDNDPFTESHLKCGDKVKFGYENILEVYEI
nr:DUF2314 domain-containing protein [uncultured Campylobacter sp.]